MSADIRRRTFITLLGGAAAAAPLPARAQQKPAMPTIGYLDVGSPDGTGHRATGLVQGLAELGFVEGRNIAIEYRWAHGRIDPLPKLAADLVRRRVDVIVAVPLPAALAAKAATSTIPIVFTSGVDPVRAGLVSSFSRPTGNLTGFTQVNHELDAKKLAIMRDLIPGRGSFAVLANTASPAADHWVPDMQQAAHAIGQTLRIIEANSMAEIDAASTVLEQQRPDALLVGGGSLFLGNRSRIVALAARHAIPAMYPSSEYTSDGGLLSYAAHRLDLPRQMGRYVARILKGERPSELPVQQPTKFELIINLKTAKALGLDIPARLLALADEVIE